MTDKISYAHKDAAAPRFVQFAKDLVPKWAVDIQPYVDAPAPSRIAAHVWARAVKHDHDGKPLWVYLADHPDFTETARALLEAYLSEMPEGLKE